MTYYILKTEVEPTVVGVTHGAGQLKGNPLYEKENAWRDDIFLYSPNKPIDSWKNWVKHELFAPKAIVGQILEKKAKKTDYIGDDGNLMGFYVTRSTKAIAFVGVKCGFHPQKMNAGAILIASLS
jgi:hypothetical protein